MKIQHHLLAAAFTVCALPAFAASTACYTPAEQQAEQLLRLHSELMVITVTCRTGSNGESLPAAYGDFTKKNINVLHDAEQTMIAYYRAHAKGNPQDHLDRLRTVLGNEYGQKDADMSAPAFCGMYRDQVLKFDTASPADIENEAQRMEISERSLVKPCKSEAVVAKRGH